jgi:hypothetical protein
MNTPEWLKPGLTGVAAGAIGVAVVGFGWGGWMTGGSAEKMAQERGMTETIAALVPFCVAKSAADPAGVAALSQASAYQRSDLVLKAGWATTPGADQGNANLARACAQKLAGGS